MASAQPTCDACGVEISDERSPAVVRMTGVGAEPAWLHKDCMDSYAPINNTRWAFLALAEDPLEIDRDGWVPMRAIEQQRGLWGSDNADFVSGLGELMTLGWAETNADESAFRLTAAGERERRAFGLSAHAWG